MSFDYKKKKYRVMYTVIIVFVAVIVSVMFYMRHPKFGRVPQGKRHDKILKSLNYRDGMFRNISPTQQVTTDKSRLDLMFDFLFEKREGTRPLNELPTIKSDLKKLNTDKELLVWLGHSSYFIQSAGKRILIDPVFEDASPLSFFNKPFTGTDIYKADDMPDIDYLIITHDHWDHLDYETVMQLKGRIGKVVCPLGIGEYFELWGFDKEQFTEMDWSEQISFEDGFSFYCLPSRHFSGRTFNSNKTLWASFMIETPQQRIYISGDGGYDKHFSQIAKKFPNIDVAIMENGQYNKNWKYIHLMPEDLGKAINDLKPQKVFAGHNSKYALSKHSWKEPLENAYAIASKQESNICMPMVGEVVNLSDTTNTNNKWWTDIN